MILDALTSEDVEQVRQWRNTMMEVWRTPYMLTKEMQKDFYWQNICNRNVNMRMWAIKIEVQGLDGAWNKCVSYDFIGMGGLENIQWENRNAEISLIIDPNLHGKGYGEEAVDMILKMGFNYLNLHSIYGEVYWCNEKGENFWSKIVRKYDGFSTILPHRKFWNGRYYDSTFFTITEEQYGEVHKVWDAPKQCEDAVAG